MTDQPTNPTAPATTTSARETLHHLAALTADPYIPERDDEDDTEAPDREAAYDAAVACLRGLYSGQIPDRVARDIADAALDVHERATGRLRAEVDRLRAERDACAESLLTAQGDLAAEAQRADRAEAERDALRERVAELEAERATHRAAVLRDAWEEGRDEGADLLRRMANTAPAGAEDGHK